MEINWVSYSFQHEIFKITCGPDKYDGHGHGKNTLYYQA